MKGTQRYKRNKNIVYACYYHVIWCPKYRRPVLDEEISKRLVSIINDVCNSCACGIEELEILPDHVHLIAECDPQFGIHKLVKTIKGKSSRILREEFPHLKSRLPTLWTNSYFVATVGGAPLSILKKYVEEQKGK